MRTWRFLTRQTISLSALTLTTERVLWVLSPITTTEPTEQQADEQIAASALRHQSRPPGFVCKTSLSPFLPHSARQDSRAARQGRIRPRINFIKHSKTPGRTRLTSLPQAELSSRTNNAHSYHSSSFCIQQICHRNPTTSLQPNKPFSYDNAEFTGNSWALSSISCWHASRVSPRTSHLEATLPALQKRFRGMDRQTGRCAKSLQPSCVWNYNHAIGEAEATVTLDG